MKYRKFGKLDWDVSEVGFGGWAIGGFWGENNDVESEKALYRAIELGITFIDTAQVYGEDGHSEKIIGRILKEVNNPSIKVATKIPPNEKGEWPPFPHEKCEIRYPEKYVREAVEKSLQRLGVESIDLLQLHTWTRAWNKDPSVLNVLSKLKKEGKIQAIGISTPEPDQNSLIDLMKAGLLDSVQVIYNIFEQEPAAEFLDVAKENGVGVIVRCVYDEGALTGKFSSETKFEENDFRRNYFKGERFADLLQRVDAIRKDIAGVNELSGQSMASVALRFALNHPAVSTVITGIRNTRQAELNTEISDLPALSSDVIRLLRKHIWRRYYWDSL